MATPFDVETFVVHDYKRPKNGELNEIEVFWRKYTPLFKERGYTVRPRYRPDWIPSWWNTSKDWEDCEDAIANFAKHLDAIGPDGSIVMIKWIEALNFPAEIPVGQLLSSERLASPRNRCMPYLDVIEPPESPDVAFVQVVMPYLLPTEQVPFETIGEAVEFFRQIFEGLEFMHENNIRHGDCKYDNIMADSVHLYKTPPHPFSLRETLDFSGFPSLIFSRTQKPLKYYLIDFDLAKEYPPGTPRLERVPWGGDRSVPEHKLGVPCDPFPVDVYCLGNCIRENFVEVRPISILSCTKQLIALQGKGFISAKKGFKFMRELAGDMINPDPSKHPTMKEASSRLNAIINGLSDRKLRSPICAVDRNMTLRESIGHWMKQYIRKFIGIPAIPRA
ncbi:hypothetical protein H0H92_000633 [Tricholoma furcatifolium]|nr:hypothetical protein H0H92_000633 [Tricholoma furcatifolium]